MTDYNAAKAPPSTPPAIDPDADPKAAAEMQAEGEQEGDVLIDNNEPDRIDFETEKALRPVVEKGRDGAGERALDAAIMLPPD